MMYATMSISNRKYDLIHCQGWAFLAKGGYPTGQHRRLVVGFIVIRSTCFVRTKNNTLRLLRVGLDFEEDVMRVSSH